MPITSEEIVDLVAFRPGLDDGVIGAAAVVYSSMTPGWRLGRRRPGVFGVLLVVGFC
jgi:hypothetical protein